MSAAQAITAREASDPQTELARLYEDHQRAIFAHCLRDLRRREDAEDALQRTFVYALMSLRRGVVPEYERAWLLKIAANVCSSFRRASARRSQIETPRDLDGLQDLVPAPQSGATGLDARELRAALDALPGAQRRAIVLREWQGLSYNEIGDRLGLTKPATEMLLFRARRTLALRLQKQRTTYAFNAASLLSWLRSLVGGSITKTGAITAAAALSAGTLPFVAPKIEAALGDARRAGKPAPANEIRPAAQPAHRHLVFSPVRAHRRAAPGSPAAEQARAIPDEAPQTQAPRPPAAQIRPREQRSATRPPATASPTAQERDVAPDTVDATPTTAIASIPTAPALPPVPSLPSPDVPPLPPAPSLSQPDLPHLPKVDAPSAPSTVGVTVPTP
jgi:RNA polymerase sigma factor (sigma-70 family)